jgi:hypothetical protein
MQNNLLLANPAGDDKLYVEDVFSTWLYNGSASNITVNNGIDLSGKGGLIWLKERNNQPGGDPNHYLTDSSSSWTKSAYSNLTNASINYSFVSSVSNTGYVDKSGFPSASNLVSWTFRKAPKFFDVVTYTGNGSASLRINHSLGTVPGMIIVKRTDSASNWAVWHRGSNITTSFYRLSLNDTYGNNSSSNYTGLVTDTNFGPSYIYDHTLAACNTSGASYVAYLFAHDTTADGIVQCGSFTTDGSGNGSPVTLGYEPQFVLIKCSSVDDGYGWLLFDTMRGFTAPGTGSDIYLRANSNAAESSNNNIGGPTSTGFSFSPLQSNATYIYLAIRRGPMRTPTDATKVFNVLTRSGTSAAATISSGFPVDMIMGRKRTVPGYTGVVDRLRGFAPQLSTEQTVAEVNDTTSITAMGNATVTVGDDSYNWGGFNQSPYTYAPLMFRRAPSFFDVVCYTGTGSARTVSHNLGVAPELIILKSRNIDYDWYVWAKPVVSPNSSWWINYSLLNATQKFNNFGNTNGLSFEPTATAVNLGTYSFTNGNGKTYVAYLFASCLGVSKVGTYTGNGSSQNIDCGFTNGARFVLIKRTDSTGSWLVSDTARGIVSGNDPSLALNSTAAEVTSLDWLDPLSTGFTVNQESTNNANVNGATYIYLAIA